MKEVTSSYDDVEKRMAIFMGLGALVFSSLYLMTRGADMWTYLVRGVLALTVFTVAGWAYGRWVRELFRTHSRKRRSCPENVERQSRDAKSRGGQGDHPRRDARSRDSGRGRHGQGRQFHLLGTGAFQPSSSPHGLAGAKAGAALEATPGPQGGGGCWMMGPAAAPRSLRALGQRGERGEQDREAFLEANLPLVKRVYSRLKIGLRRARSPAAPRGRPTQCGAMGLIQAYDKYDGRGGNTFARASPATASAEQCWTSSGGRTG